MNDDEALTPLERGRMLLVLEVLDKKHITIDELVRRAYFYYELPLSTAKLNFVLAEIREYYVRNLVINYCLEVILGRVHEVKPMKLLGGNDELL